MSFLIVEFLPDKIGGNKEPEIAIIPDNWLDGTKCAVWPTCYNYTKLSKAIRTREKPANDWKSFPMRVLDKADQYERALQKLRKAEETSDLQTTSSEEELEEEFRLSKRKKNQSSLYVVDTDMSGVMPGKGKIVIERTAMAGNARSEGGSVKATAGGADHIPDGMDVHVREVAMTDHAHATNTDVQASQNRDLFVGGQAVQEDRVDGTAWKCDINFGHTNAAALCVAGAGKDSDVFKSDVDQMEKLLKGSSVGISEDKIFTVKPRPTIKKTAKSTIGQAISDIKDVLEDCDDGCLIFFYSGHFGKNGFLVDGKKDRKVDLYTEKELADALMKIPAKYVLLILDMCRSGTAELGAKDEDGLEEEEEEGEEAEPNLCEFYLSSIGAKEDDGGASVTTEKVVQWSSSGQEVSYNRTGQSSFFTQAIVDIITHPEKGKGVRDELASGQTHVTVLDLHKHVTHHMQMALKKYKVSQTPVIKPPYADVEYFKQFPYFAKLL